MNKILFFLVVLYAIPGFSQESKFTQKWKTIDSLEIEGSIETADSLVSEILKTSNNHEDYPDFIKAKIYHYKYFQINHENSDFLILEDLNQTLKKADFPYKNVLYSYKASLLEDYFSNHRWQIQNRKKIDNAHEKDIETWSTATLQDSIQFSFNASLKNPEKLTNVPVENFEVLLKPSEFNRKLRPTLFDLLAGRYIEYFSNSSQFESAKPEKQIGIDVSKLFSVNGDFLALSFSEESKENRQLKVLQIFQMLEKLHKKNNSLAYVNWVLERLDYVSQIYNDPDEEILYSEALDLVSEKFKKGLKNAYILYAKANNYYLKSSEKDEDEDENLKHPEFLEKADTLCGEIIKEYPETQLQQKAYHLRTVINEIDLNAKIQEYIIPQTPSRIRVSYTNLDTLVLKVFRVPENYLKNTHYRQSDSIVLEKIKNEAFFQKRIKLPKANDHNAHSVEILLPKFKKGTYLLYAGNDSGHQKPAFTYSKFQVTNLAISKTVFDKNTVFQVLERDSGKKTGKIKIDNHADLDNKNNFTDAEGKYVVSNTRNYSFSKHSKYVLSADVDTLSTNLQPGYYRYNAKNDALKAKSLLFLDRAIYRPGQQVYFKGILLKYENKKTSTVPNETVKVIVEDANGNEIESFRLKTNKYGSFDEKFILPKSGITGVFRIHTEEDDTSESTFWKQLKKNRSYSENESTFRVEEYKRPTFKITFNKPETAFQLNDSIQIKGKAESFLGANLAETRVIYKVTRQRKMYFWWRHGYQDKTIILQDTVITDAKGNFNVSFKSLINEEDKNDENLTYNYLINAEATDVNGETREGSTEVLIGKKNLLLTVSGAATIEAEESGSYTIKSTNLNKDLVKVEGKITIYKLKAPERILHDRLWEPPQINIIPENKFKTLFPEEPYNSKLEPQNWPKGKVVYQKEFTSDGTYNFMVKTKNRWKSGKYLIEVTAKDSNNTTSAAKELDVFHANDDYLADNGRFSASIQNKITSEKEPVHLLLQTAYKELYLQVSVYDSYNEIYNGFIKIDGRKELEIPIANSKSQQLKIRVSGLKNNAKVLQELDITIPKKEKFLSIETETFRNKIEPGTKETWSFKIKNQDNSIPDAEFLASMYDASLDIFSVSKWNSEPHFDYIYYRYPSFNFSTVEKVSQLNDRNYYKLHYQNYKEVFDQLNTFGFYYSTPNSYVYRTYLARKKRDLENPDLGNATGMVTDTQGQAVAGVNVVIANSSKGTQTDSDGKFYLDVKKGDILIFTYVGFLRYEYVVPKNSKEIFVVMQEDRSSLDEVVSVANGAPAPPKDAIVLPALGINRGMQLNYSVEGSSITIRGNSSITSEENPLYVVDGKPVTDTDLNINSEDILSIKVLKGSEATALYGTRGKNGVVLITTKNAVNELSQVRARKNLDETAFFYPHLTLDEKGKLKFSFTSPEALSSWKFRLLGHTSNWVTGEFESMVQTQKELNVTPNAPRYLRENDSIVLKAKISNLTDKKLEGLAVLQLYDAVTMKPIDTLLANKNNIQNFSASAQNGASVSWKLFIPKGTSAVTYKILAKANNFSDGEENILPVLTNRMLVTESIPLFVRSKKTKEFEFNTLKNNTSYTLQNHKFTLEYTSNPAWYAIQSLPYLMEFEHECSEQTFARLYANSIAAHILNSQPKIKAVFDAWKKDSTMVSKLEKNEQLKSLILAETPWVRDAESETEQKRRIAQLFDLTQTSQEQQNTLLKLQQMQLNSGAFPWFQGGRANPYITRHILAGLAHLKKLGVKIDDYQIEKKGIAYIDSDFLDNYNKYKDNSGFYETHRELHYLYTRSSYLEDFPLSEKIKPIFDSLVINLKTELNTGNLYDQALKIIILKRMNEKTVALKIVNSLKQKAVKSNDYGIYWKSNKPGWYWYQAPIETQALLIEAFTEVGNQEKAIEEMKIWLLQNKRTNNWPTTKATTEACYALLMQGKDWLNILDNTQIQIGNKTINSQKLKETEKEAGTGYFQVSWQPEEIDTSFSKITIQNNSSTAGFGGAYWQYFEDLDKIKESEKTPLSIEKSLYLNIPGNELQRITSKTPLKVGDLVTVRLVVKAGADMDFIHLKDMRASGFEPTNVLSEYKYQDGTSYYESTRDAATHFFFDKLRKGTYVLEYTVRANNAGNFSNGITTIESMYAPEFSGHTQGIRVKIIE